MPLVDLLKGRLRRRRTSQGATTPACNAASACKRPAHVESAYEHEHTSPESQTRTCETSSSAAPSEASAAQPGEPATKRAKVSIGGDCEDLDGHISQRPKRPASPKVAEEGRLVDVKASLSKGEAPNRQHELLSTDRTGVQQTETDVTTSGQGHHHYHANEVGDFNSDASQDLWSDASGDEDTKSQGFPHTESVADRAGSDHQLQNNDESDVTDARHDHDSLSEGDESGEDSEALEALADLWADEASRDSSAVRSAANESVRHGSDLAQATVQRSRQGLDASSAIVIGDNEDALCDSASTLVEAGLSASSRSRNESSMPSGGTGTFRADILSLAEELKASEVALRGRRRRRRPNSDSALGYVAGEPSQQLHQSQQLHEPTDAHASSTTTTMVMSHSNAIMVASSATTETATASTGGTGSSDGGSAGLRQRSLAAMFGWRRAVSAPASASATSVSTKGRAQSLFKDSFQRTGQYVQNKRSCPFYKRVLDTSFVVDAFSYGAIDGCQGYFLSHFHGDHYQGLGPRFSGVLYCSAITARLVELKLRVRPDVIRILPMYKPTKIGNVDVTLIDANHCPGAVMFLFHVHQPSGHKVLLHCGDCRASAEMLADTKRVLEDRILDTLYLDTTYCDEKHKFPSQREVVNFVVNIVLKHLKRHPSSLIAVGSYTIGKERLFVAIAEALNCRVWAEPHKRKILSTFHDKALDNMLTVSPAAARIHVVGMGDVTAERLEQRLKQFPKYDHILGFRPTGWTYDTKIPSLSHIKPHRRQNITLYGIPYSEHSSYDELKRFVSQLRPKRVIPTVNNGSATARRKMALYFQNWLKPKRLAANAASSASATVSLSSSSAAS